jgi:alkylation response protein AidB-like acyl-CoA dehydrogenase
MSITSLQTEALLFHLVTIGDLSRLQATELFSHIDSETITMMLEQAAGFATSSLLPLAASGDVSGAQLIGGKVTLPPGTVGAYSEWCSLGFPALGMPVEYEGLGFPRIVQSAAQELCDGANLAFGMLGINLRCAALALIKNASDELKARWIPGLVRGEIASTIVISEPQAGSDVGRILTAARPQDDGSWLIKGSKIWISYGDHDATGQILHLVLARVPNGEAGTRGLALFAVPKFVDDPNATNGISIVRLEHKMGLHASPTCVLDLNDARGYLVGESGRGLQALFVMMNAMRLAVAVQGSAVANAATLHAIDYAVLRPQGGNPVGKPTMISDHPDVKRMLLEMSAESELVRALALRTASFLDLAEAENSEEKQALGELLLPIAKTIGSETAFQVANQGIQVLGGYGYTNDYPLERLARDVRVTAIYEGTSGIQALDFLKRKVLADKGALLKKLLLLISADAAAGTSPFTAALHVLPELLIKTLDSLLGIDERKNGASADGAYAFLQLSGIVVHAWNGHVLFRAATESSAYQQRLRAALELFAPRLVDKATLWAGKAITPLPDYSFPK